MTKLKLTSPAFSDGGEIPRECGYKHGNKVPPLKIDCAYTRIKSLALIMDDPDAMGAVGKVWVHWVVWNIEPDTDDNGNMDNIFDGPKLSEKIKPHKLGTNDFSEEGSLENYFHLAKTISATNMYLFDSLGEIKKYNSAEDILRDYFLTRIEMYRKRLDLLRGEANARVTLTSSKARFIESVVDGSISILGLTRDRWIGLLNEKEFPEIDESYEYY